MTEVQGGREGGHASRQVWCERKSGLAGKAAVRAVRFGVSGNPWRQERRTGSGGEGMQAYQDEYIANLREIASLTMGRRQEGQSFEDYLKQADREKRQAEEKGKRNMLLLREELFPALDHIYDAGPEEVQGLEEFAGQLFDGREELDLGLFCQIRKALLSLARQRKKREDMIRQLYWLGMGYHGLCNKLVGLDWSQTRNYTSRMRLCFTEAAAYLKYYDEIEDRETRGYILRSRANMALGRFNSAGEKIRMVRRTLEILQDKGYQEKEPGLPWDRFIYMTHQQMAASISHSKNDQMSPEDVEAVMESVYIVYQRRLQEAAERKEKPPLRPGFSYNVIEYYCGMFGLDELLARLEKLMDEADPADFSGDGMYGIISLPAFYCQYLSEYPEKIPKREEYIGSLYQRALDYVDAFPKASESETLFLYLRQLSYTFLETGSSISYKEYMIRLMIRFAPEIYAHSWVVARAAVAFCGIILEEEPAFFDDIESVREIAGPEEKRREILSFALEAGLLHDVGKINFMGLYTHTARQWFEEEYEMAHLHALVGATWLSGRESTEKYAPVALGHHYWYDGSRGYPDSYRRLECSCRQIVDIIGLFDWMNNVTDTARLYTGVEKTFEEAVEAAVALEGRRFSPLLTARLRDGEIVERMKRAFEESRREGYRQLYEKSLQDMGIDGMLTGCYDETVRTAGKRVG